MKYSTLERDLELAVEFGYDSIEIRFDKLHDYLRRHTKEDLKEFFDTHTLKAYAFDAILFPNLSTEENFQSCMEELALFCEVGQMIGCNKTVVVPAINTDYYTVEEIKNDFVKVLNVMADYAEPRGMNLALELLGYPICSVNTFNQAMDIVKAVNRDSVGIVVDCFHFFSMGSRLSDLAEADLPKVVVFHLDDGQDSLPGMICNDDTRLFPGDGVYPLEDILKILKDKGYDDTASVELFRPEYYEMDIKELFKTAKETSLREIRKVY